MTLFQKQVNQIKQSDGAPCSRGGREMRKRYKQQRVSGAGKGKKEPTSGAQRGGARAPARSERLLSVIQQMLNSVETRRVEKGSESEEERAAPNVHPKCGFSCGGGGGGATVCHLSLFN